jgi:hypothetical protein
VNSKLGVHVTTGPRSSYGRFSLRLRWPVNEGGMLTGTSSPTIAIYRDTTLFGDAPPGIDETNEEGARASRNIFPATQGALVDESRDILPTIQALSTRLM